MFDLRRDCPTNSLTGATSPTARSEADIPPLLTIGMPVFNGAATIRAALDALLAQTFRDFVLVISDNCSDDDTITICHEYMQRDSRVRLVQQPSNLGAPMNFR